MKQVKENNIQWGAEVSTLIHYLAQKDTSQAKKKN